MLLSRSATTLEILLCIQLVITVCLLGRHDVFTWEGDPHDSACTYWAALPGKVPDSGFQHVLQVLETVRPLSLADALYDRFGQIKDSLQICLAADGDLGLALSNSFEGIVGLDRYTLDGLDADFAGCIVFVDLPGDLKRNPQKAEPGLGGGADPGRLVGSVIPSAD